MVAMATQEVVPPETPARTSRGTREQRARSLSRTWSQTTTFRLAATPADRRAAFRLAYDIYIQHGMLEPNWYGLRVTEFHLLETTAVFLAERDGSIVGTVTLIGDGALGLPLDAVHPEITTHARRRGLRMGEASCLAIRSRGFLPDLPVFVGLTRLMAQYARTHDIRQLLAACIPQHAEFYRRFLGFEQIGHVRPFPMVCDTLGVACRLDFDEIDRHRPDCYGTYFNDPIPPQVLVNTPMSDFERGVYARVMKQLHDGRRRSA